MKWRAASRRVDNITNRSGNLPMKALAVLVLLHGLLLGLAHAAPATPPPQQSFPVTPEIKKPFPGNDSIQIQNVTGTTAGFQSGGIYRVIGTCRQQTLTDAALYLGNTAGPGGEAIAASAGSSLYQTLPHGVT